MSDILCTAWHGTELGRVGKGDTVAIWGQGPGRFACFMEVHSHAFVHTRYHAEKAACTLGVIVGCSDKPAWEFAVGLLAAKLCQIRGAGRVIVIDAVDYRLEFAKHKVGL